MKHICLFMSVRMRERASRSATQIRAVDFPLKFSPFTFSSLWKGSGATTPKTTTAPVSQIDTLSFLFQPKSQLLQKSPFLLALSSLAVTSETWINLTGLYRGRVRMIVSAHAIKCSNLHCLTHMRAHTQMQKWLSIQATPLVIAWWNAEETCS